MKLATCNDVDGTRDYNGKQNRSIRERQISYDFTHLQDLRNKRNKQRGKERKRGKPRNRLLTLENTLMVTRGEVGEGMGETGDGDEGGHLG